MKYAIPNELINMVRGRTVIPFIGAGFSQPAKLPDWKTLMEKLADEEELSSFYPKDDPSNQMVPHEEVKRSCENDPLQIAEYYYIKNKKDIGPIRHLISRQLIPPTDYSPLNSGSHVELVNLGAPQIYTTNYDDLIETTYKNLNLPYQVIALPAHMAVANNKKTQIIKYHGDLRFEKTLVLTESSYFSRLAFESPMDLKFRSDILGRAVLFMGYSLRDITIRIIWFKLTQMMKDIKGFKSYIVKFEPDPVLETLYDAAGIQTIVLDPERTTKTGEEKCELLADFIHELAREASPEGIIPGHNRQMFSTKALLARIAEDYNIAQRTRNSYIQGNFDNLNTALIRDIRKEHVTEVDETLEKIAKFPELVSESLVQFALSLIKKYGSSIGINSILACGLVREATRKIILDYGLPWETLLGKKISKDCAESLLDIFKGEIEALKLNWINEDVAYLLDLAFRIKSAYLVEASESLTIKKAEDLIKELGQIYSEAGVYTVEMSEQPNLVAILDQIKEMPNTK